MKKAKRSVKTSQGKKLKIKTNVRAGKAYEHEWDRF